MSIDNTKLAVMLLSASRLLQEKSDELSALDAKFGDGDHGVTIAKIAHVIEDHTSRCSNLSLKSFFSELGGAVMNVSGGAAAPLWGTFIGGLSLPIPESATQIDPPLLKQMFSSALQEMRDITNAKQGDKTLMDVLIPVVERVADKNSIAEILKTAAHAASKGARDTENFAARFGRAKNYGERSLGTPDPGAVSMALFFKGLATGFDSE